MEAKSFLDWFSVQNFTKKVFIAGNHDLCAFSFQETTKKEGGKEDENKEWQDLLQNYPNVVYLKDSGTTLYFESDNQKGGKEEKEEKEENDLTAIKIYGSPWTIDIGSYFNAFTMDYEENLFEKHTKIPDDLDILITHGPPLGHCDLTPRFVKRLYQKPNEPRGDAGLLLAVEKKKPRYHIFGHIHSGYGSSTNQKTIFINASSCNEENKVSHAPFGPILF